MFKRLILAFVLIVPVACGPASRTENDGGTGSGKIAIDDLPNAIVTNYCSVLVRCGLFGDSGMCESSFGNQIVSDKGFNSLGATVAAVKAGKVTYDGDAAKGCLSNLSQLSCDSFQINGFGDIQGCASVFTGSIADGQSCVVDQECHAGSFCKGSTSSSAPACSGTCTAGGTECHDSTQCTGGKVCDQQGSSGTCVTPVPAAAVNQPCGTNGACQSGLYCDSSSSSGPPVCKARGTSGQPCRSGFMSSCASGLICVQSDTGGSATCLEPKTKGATCEAAAQCGGSLSLLVCDSGTHKCVDRPTSGPCVSNSYFGCDIRTTYCDYSSQTSPTCKPYKALGATCNPEAQECGFGIFGSANSCTPNGSGSTGTCTAPEPGEVCTP